jgi:dUTP pyrophosphatase
VSIKVKVKKTKDYAKMPVYATSGAACFDLYGQAETSLKGRSVIYNTGLSFEIPSGYVMLVFSRSGHGFNKDVRLANCVGVIDSDYRGEVRVKLTHDKKGPVPVGDGSRIAQAMVLPVPFVELVEAEELSETKRGEGGYGSTGS